MITQKLVFQPLFYIILVLCATTHVLSTQPKVWIKSNGDVYVAVERSSFRYLTSVANPIGGAVYISPSGSVWFEASPKNWIEQSNLDCKTKNWLSRLPIGFLPVSQCENSTTISKNVNTETLTFIKCMTVYDVYGRVVLQTNHSFSTHEDLNEFVREVKEKYAGLLLFVGTTDNANAQFIHCY